MVFLLFSKSGVAARNVNALRVHHAVFSLGAFGVGVGVVVVSVWSGVCVGSCVGGGVFVVVGFVVGVGDGLSEFVGVGVG